MAVKLTIGDQAPVCQDHQDMVQREGKHLWQWTSTNDLPLLQVSPFSGIKPATVGEHFSFHVPGRSKMERGISKASENEYIISQARNHVESQFQTSPDSPDIGSSNLKFSTQKEVIDTPVYTFTLPDLTIYPGRLLATQLTAKFLVTYFFPILLLFFFQRIFVAFLKRI